MENTQNTNLNNAAAPDESAIEFNNKTHSLGRVFMLLALLVLLAVPFIIAALFRTGFSAAGVLASLPTILVYLVTCVVEVLIYAPMLGTGATYLAFVTGNLSNLKIPCAVNAREMAGTKYGSKESEIISTLSVGASTIVTTLVIAIGVVFLSQFRPILESPALQPAFNNVVPALFGAMGMKFFSKDPKLAIAPMVAMLIICFTTSLGVSYLLPIGGGIAILACWLLYKKGWVK